jgi:crotonobetainyl-CoA:carnitine CoA-transferase CaiB-like acyl-CoA transferase
MPGALDGVKVVELALWAATPAGGGIMADWGAEVIKVEDPDAGDPIPPYQSSRYVRPDQNPWWSDRRRYG